MPRPTREQVAALDRALPEWPLRALNLMYGAGLDVEAALAALAGRTPFELDLALMEGGATAGLADAGAPANGQPRRMAALALAVLEVIEAFWQRCFSQVWELQSAMLDDVARQITAHVASGSAAALERLTPRARAPHGRDTVFLASSQQSGMVDCALLDRLEILPSLWLRRSTVAVEAATHVGICVHTRTRRAVEALSSAQLVQVMNVLGDPQRFEIVRLCSSRARSTQELSRLLGITPAPVSRHLRQLRAVDLVVGRRVGRYVLYETIPETLNLVTSHLDEFSREAIGDADNVAYLEAEVA